MNISIEEQLDLLNKNYMALNQKVDNLILLMEHQFRSEMMAVNNFDAIDAMEFLRSKYDAERRLKDMELETWMKEHGLSMKPKP